MSCSFSRPKEADFELVYIEGLYNFVFPFDFKTDTVRPGQSNFMTLVRQQRDIWKDHCLVLDGGNRLFGAIPSRYYNYVDTITEPISFRADRIVGYDFTGIGQTDLESELILEQKRWNIEKQPPVICANLIDRKTGKSLFKPYIIIERAGIRIAIMGMTTTELSKWLPVETWRKVEIQDMIECATQWMPRIKAEKPDLIIGVFCCSMNYEGRGYDIDTYKNPNGGIPAAIRVPGFDLLLMGNNERSEVRYEKDDEGREFPCMTVGEAARYAGLINIHMTKQVDGSYKKVITPSIVNLADLAPDPDFMEQTKDAFDSIYTWMHTPVGYLGDTIFGWKGYFEPDYYRDLIHRSQMMKVPEADISMASCLIGQDTILPGPITPFMIQHIYPFENYVETIQMTGDDVIRFLEWAVDLQFSTMKNPNSNMLRLRKEKDGSLKRNEKGEPSFEISPSYFTSAQGIKYQIDITKPFGQRVKVLSMQDGSPFIPGKRYLVVLNSHQANNGGLYIENGLGWDNETLSLHIVTRPQVSERIAMQQYIQSLGSDTLHLGLNPAWSIVPQEWWAQEGILEQHRPLPRY